jgi:hypothetical protein
MRARGKGRGLTAGHGADHQRIRWRIAEQTVDLEGVEAAIPRDVRRASLAVSGELTLHSRRCREPRQSRSVCIELPESIHAGRRAPGSVLIANNHQQLIRPHGPYLVSARVGLVKTVRF